MDVAAYEVILTMELFELITSYQDGIYIDMKELVCMRPVPEALFRPTVLKTKMTKIQNRVQGWLEQHGRNRLPLLFQCIPLMHHIMVQYAVYYGDLDLLRFLHSLQDLTETIQENLWDLASLQNHLTILKFLYDIEHHGYSFNAIQWACEYGYLDIVKFLNQNVPNDDDEWTTGAMDVAAAQGHLNIVTFLHQNRTEGCTTNAMDKAAANGHLPIVMYLHSNRTEGCTVAAMNLALSYNHMDVFKWLHAHRNEGCTTQAMNLASGDGDIDIVRWLHVNRSEGCTQEAMDDAAASGHLNIVKYLFSNSLAKCSRVALSRAIQNGHDSTVVYLREHGALNEPQEYTPRYHI